MGPTCDVHSSHTFLTRFVILSGAKDLCTWGLGIPVRRSVGNNKSNEVQIPRAAVAMKFVRHQRPVVRNSSSCM
jgi:hypothetical protein